MLQCDGVARFRLLDDQPKKLSFLSSMVLMLLLLPSDLCCQGRVDGLILSNLDCQKKEAVWSVLLFLVVLQY